MDTENPIQFITYLALNKDRIFHLSQADFCQTMQVFSVERKKLQHNFLIRQNVCKNDCGLFLSFDIVLDDCWRLGFFFLSGNFLPLVA